MDLPGINACLAKVVNLDGTELSLFTATSVSVPGSLHVSAAFLIACVAGGSGWEHETFCGEAAFGTEVRAGTHSAGYAGYVSQYPATTHSVPCPLCFSKIFRLCFWYLPPNFSPDPITFATFLVNSQPVILAVSPQSLLRSSSMKTYYQLRYRLLT